MISLRTAGLALFLLAVEIMPLFLTMSGTTNPSVSVFKIFFCELIFFLSGDVITNYHQNLEILSPEISDAAGGPEVDAASIF